MLGRLNIMLGLWLIGVTPGIVAASPGEVTRVAGELAYVSGLNGSAPLWSTLEVSAGNGQGAGLEVIKQLPDLLVTRVMKTGTGITAGDQVVVREKGSEQSLLRSRRIAHATRVAQGPVVNGRLDDEAWAHAKPIRGFVQRDPNYWLPSSEETVALIVYDDKSLYFGFECRLPNEDGVVANNMRRDSDIFGDDNIQIMLDTYNDRQNGFFFFINALGAQSDVMLSNEGRSYNFDWDCNWTSRAHVYPDRWTVEVEIPFSQLRFKEADEMIWGINLARFNARKNESSQLVVGNQSSSPTERYRMSDIGELRGLGRIKAKRPIQVKPYVLPGTTIDYLELDPEEDPSFEAGVDLRYGVTSNLSLDVSYNTDFAQVEGDQEQTNLTQFRLFFPEKREFFLEGANLFEFGEQARRTGSGTRPPTLLFYSRRIGLEAGRKIPIILGTKFAGKEGRTSVGALNVVTDDISFVDDGDTTRVEKTNYSVLSLRRDIFSKSNVGLMVVNKQIDDPALGWDQYNRAAGIDFNYSPTRNLNFQAFTSATWDSEVDDTDAAHFAMMNFRGTKYWLRTKYLEVEDNFDPAVGFVNRRKGLEGFRRYDLYARWRPKPDIGSVRYMSIGPEAQVITDRDNNVKYWTAELSWFTSFNTGDFLSMQAVRTHDVVDEAFSPSDRRDDIVIPAGDYTFTSISTGNRPSRARKLRPEFGFEVGTYYTGRRYTFDTELVYLPSGRLSYEMIYEGNWLRLPQGNATIHTVTSRALYSFSTDFFVKLFVQWNNDKETFSTNFLLNYRYRPGSDIFFVFDSGFDTFDGLSRRNRSMLLKWSYLMNL